MAQCHPVEPFDPSSERIEDYKERFDFYCTAHGIEGKQKALFLTRIGQKMYTKLKTWISPTSLSDLTLDEIVAKLKDRTSAETVEIAERYRFFKRLQQPEEAVIDHMSELRKLAKSCNFAKYLNTALHDQFVCGLRDSHVQQELLSVKNLTVAQALEKAQAMEAASREARAFQQSGCQEDQIKQTHLLSKATPQKASCFRCGNLKHTAAMCPHKDKQCNNCRKIGHLACVCRSSNSAPQRLKKKSNQQSRTTHLVEAVVMTIFLMQEYIVLQGVQDTKSL